MNLKAAPASSVTSVRATRRIDPCIDPPILFSHRRYHGSLLWVSGFPESVLPHPFLLPSSPLVRERATCAILSAPSASERATTRGRKVSRIQARTLNGDISFKSRASFRTSSDPSCREKASVLIVAVMRVIDVNICIRNLSP